MSKRYPVTNDALDQEKEQEDQQENKKNTDIAIPDKFLSPETGELRVEALLTSYKELEKKLGEKAKDTSREKNEGNGDQQKNDLQELSETKAPIDVDEYQIDLANSLFERDAETEEKLRNAGFSEKQVQMVYDLATEKLYPFIEGLQQSVSHCTTHDRLEQHFGGAEKWQQIQKQLWAWATKNLPEESIPHLTNSYEGVMAIYRMMNPAEEPSLIRDGKPSSPVSEESLREMMRTPAYWRDKNPALMERVKEGFRRLYPE